MTPQRIINSAKDIAKFYAKKGHDFTVKREKKSYRKLSPKIEKQLFIAALAIVLSGVLRDITNNLSYHQIGGAEKIQEPRSLLGDVENIASTVVSKVGETAGNVFGKVEGVASTVAGKVEGVASTVAEKVENIAENVVGEAPVKFVTGAAGYVGKTLKNNAAELADEAEDFANKSIRALPKATDGLTAGLMVAMEKSGDFATKLIDLSTLGVLDKKWGDLFPKAEDRVKFLTKIVERAQYDPQLQAAIVHLSQKVGEVGSEILLTVTPSLDPMTKMAFDLVKDTATTAASGLMDTGIAVASAAVAEIPVMGGVVDLLLAFGKGFNTGAKVFKSVIDMGSPLIIKGTETASNVKKVIDDNADDLKERADNVQTISENLTNKVANTLTAQKGGFNQLEKNKHKVKLSVSNFVNSLPEKQQYEGNTYIKTSVIDFLNSLPKTREHHLTTTEQRLKQSITNFSTSLPQKYKIKEQLLLQSISNLVNSLPKIEKSKQRLHNSIMEFKSSLPKTRYITSRTHKNRTRRKKRII